MATATANQSTEQVDTVNSVLLKEKQPGPYNPWWMLTSFLMVVAISVFLYVIVDYYYIEIFTRDIVVLLLNLTGVDSVTTESVGVYFPASPEWAQFGEAYADTPGAVIPGSGYSAFWIVKACTGMQAGAILIALIYVTPLPNKGKFSDPNVNFSQLSAKDRFRVNHPLLYSLIYKTAVAVFFYLILFFTNSLRIWFHLYLVGAWELPFSFAHDDLSKPIGFVGTLVFAWIIEKCGIPIIDTFADWLDALYYGIKGIYNKF